MTTTKRSNKNPRFVVYNDGNVIIDVDSINAFAELGSNAEGEITIYAFGKDFKVKAEMSSELLEGFRDEFYILKKDCYVRKTSLRLIKNYDTDNKNHVYFVNGDKIESFNASKPYKSIEINAINK